MTLRTLYFSFAAAAVLGLAGGCADDNPAAPGYPDGSREGMLTLSLNALPTRGGADQDRELNADADPFNEFKIDNVYFFVFDKAPADIADSDKPVFRQYTDKSGATDSYGTYTVAVPYSALGSVTNSSVYVLANLPAEAKAAVDAITEPTYAQLRTLSVTSAFTACNQPQPSFVMEGLSGTLSQGNAPKSATGTVSLTRSAAKITLNLQIPHTITVSEGGQDVTYEAQVNTALVARIANTAVSSPVVADATAPGFKPGRLASANEWTAFNGGTGGDYPYTVAVPFYSYPNNWTGTTDNTRRTYLTLGVAWKKQGSSTVQNYYYQVPVNSIMSGDTPDLKATREMLVRNTAYTVNLKVAKLGSLNVEEPADVELHDLQYGIRQWDAESADVSLEGVRYLQMDKEGAHYVMNGTTQLDMTFQTSHPAEVVTDAYLTFTDFSKDNPVVHKIPLGTCFYTKSNTSYQKTDNPVFTLETDNTDGKVTVKFNHGLHLIKVDSTSTTKFYPMLDDSNMSYSKFELHYTVRHKDDPSILQKVIVTQYPPIWMEAEASVAANVKFDTNYVGRVGYNNSTQSGNNDNYNNYTFHVNKLSDNSYIIGDPRVENKENLLIAGSVSSTGSGTKKRYSLSTIKYYDAVNTSETIATKGPHTSETGTSNILTHYYTTASTEDKSTFIAPAFTIASSRGKTTDIYYLDAQTRCAMYQENGRPAGRWRIPTTAEVEFICNLSAKGLIPVLFGKKGGGTSNYWTGDGKVTIVINATNSSANTVTGTHISDITATSNLTEEPSQGPVRCVYDDWYWGDERLKDKTVWTWGDEKRTRSN